ncbi:MAG TPA: benzoylformate decarboxylase [Steroidobacteraceae bacterium]|nr:benzoylformate decarboxylase [Steroidobacteraceae bacterium]
MTTVHEETFRLLRHLGMQRVFGNPGSTELAFLRDFPADFQYVLALQEAVAVGMADGYAQATRRAALVNLHSAVGVGHAMGNIFTAYRNRTPLVITAGQQARSLLQLDPFLFSERAAELPQPYVKWSIEPARAADVPRALQRAWHIAMQPPHGPVFVSIPSDDWDEPAETVAPHAVAAAGRADSRALAALAHSLAASRRPVFVVGAGVDRDGAWQEIVALAELHGALVWASPLIGRASFPEDHPQFAGFLPAFREEIHRRLRGHDLLLAVGAPIFTYHAPGTGPCLPEDLAVHQLTDEPSMAAAALAGESVVGGIRESLRELVAAGRTTPPGVQRGRSPVPLLPLADPLTDRLLLQMLAELRAPDSIIVEEAPSSREPMHDHLPILRPDTFYTCSSGGLGHALPAAVGIALARPDSRVIALLGDGSAMYCIQGLWSAAQLRLPMTFIIINNGRYEALRQIGARLGNAQPVGVELPGLDFVELARAQGCEACRVSTAAQLRPALRAALASTAPMLVEVRVG